VLILIVILLFALFAIAGLLIDIGMARLTQAHMQSVSDAASLEGGWQLAMGANQTTTRIAVVDRAAEMSESWGPHRIELEDGYNLGGSGKPESSQTINRDTLGDPVRPMLDPNVDNDLEGDIVLGKYCDCRENTECWKEFQLNPLPGQPVGYGRGKMFEPTARRAIPSQGDARRRPSAMGCTPRTSNRPLAKTISPEALRPSD